MIKDLPDGEVKVTCACGADDCETADSAGVHVEIFELQDLVDISVADNTGKTGWTATVSLPELRRALDGARS